VEETCLVLIKPHAIHLFHWILQMLMVPGARILGLKLVPEPDRATVTSHYEEHEGRDYFEWLCTQLIDHPVIAILLSGNDINARIRAIVGPTAPENNPPNTIRGKFSDDRLDTSRQEKRAVRNVVHASEIERSEREREIWFNSSEVI
jgi:nucleoside-diphosphate kinase